MATPSNINSAQSNAPISLPPLDVSTPAGTTPGNVGTNINNEVIKGSGGFLQYPNDAPKYFMAFSISKYNRANLNTVGNFQDAGYPGIILPLPLQLVDTNHVNWAPTDIGFLPGIAINGVAGLASQITNQAKTGFSDTSLTELGAAGGTVAATAVAGGLADAAFQSRAGIAAQAFGIAPNQFVTMLMRGPMFKKHIFTWNFSPNNYAEADNLRKIINVFKNASAPNSIDFMGGPILWTYPKIFRLRLYPNSKFLYKFKPCICDMFTVNYTPGGHPNFHMNPTSDAGGNSPVGYQIQAHFWELEFWTEGQYSNGNVGGDGDNDPDNVRTGIASS